MGIWPWNKLRWPAHASRDKRQVDALRASLNREPAELPTDELYPLLVPAAISEAGTFPGPLLQLRIQGLAMAWAVLQPGQTMRYVDRATERHWAQQGLDWRMIALANLRRAVAGGLWTHEFRRDSGELYAAGMMHSDGIGPSRLLLPELLTTQFPAGYQVAVPERSCGIVLSRDAREHEAAQLRDVADTCFERGTSPVIRGFHAPDELTPTNS
jgi:hypothetical protein